MNVATCSEVLSETDEVKDHCGIPRAGPVPRVRCTSEQTATPTPVGPCVSDEGDFSSFIDGAGI